jgi:hypothetical protein
MLRSKKEIGMKIDKLMVCVVVGLIALCAMPQAQGQRTHRMTPQHILAVLTVSESGWVTREESEDGVVSWSNDRDMHGIHAVLLRGVQRTGLSYEAFARSYARGVIGRRRAISRTWLWGLHPDGRRPATWPESIWVTDPDTGRLVSRRHAEWSTFSGRWGWTYARAGEVVALSLDTWSDWGPCADLPPDDWGGDMDHGRAMRIGLVEIGCGETANHYYLRPSTIAARE